ncbi:MAG: LysR family transcriptional regulator [Rhodocyclaceae bacterium]
MKIDFDGIQAFVAIAELGGFSKAAEQLHVTQTALTRRVQKLEAYLNLRLFDRTTRYVELTAVGREFLPQAKAIVNEMMLAVGRLKDMSKHARGSVTLACVPTMASHVLPAAIRRYAEGHPGNRIRLIDTSAYEVRDAVLQGQAEIGIGVPTDRHPELLETPLLEEPLMFFCREEHPLSGRMSVTWSDMREADLVVVSSMTATRVFTDYQLAKRGISLSGAYEVQHHATAISLVAAGVGAAILPASTLDEGARPGVRRIPLTNPVVKRRISIIRRKNSTLSPAANAFFEVLVGDARV